MKRFRRKNIVKKLQTRHLKIPRNPHVVYQLQVEAIGIHATFENRTSCVTNQSTGHNRHQTADRKTALNRHKIRSQFSVELRLFMGELSVFFFSSCLHSSLFLKNLLPRRLKMLSFYFPTVVVFWSQHKMGKEIEHN